MRQPPHHDRVRVAVHAALGREDEVPQQVGANDCAGDGGVEGVDVGVFVGGGDVREEGAGAGGVERGVGV